MGLGSTFVDVFRRIIGISKEPPIATLQDSAASSPASAADEEGEDEEADEATSVEDEWADMQAFVARCEAEALDLAGIDVADPASYWMRHRQIEAGVARGRSRDESAREAGFTDARHWEWVSQYVQTKWSELIRHESRAVIRQKAAFVAASERGQL